MSGGSDHFDVAIAGAGLVGSVLAVALASAGLRVGVFEARPATAFARDELSPDASSPSGRPKPGRPIALAQGTRRVLEALDLWDALADRAHPIRRIHVSQQAAFGVTCLSTEQFGVDALGYVMDSRELDTALFEALAARSANLALTTGCIVTDVLDGPAGSRLMTARSGDPSTRDAAAPREDGNPEAASASLFVVASGLPGGHPLAERLGMTGRSVEYGQWAMVADVSVGRWPGETDDRGYTAYERFTAEGPVALLPLSSSHYGLVWTGPRERMEGLCECTPELALNELRAVGAGRFEHLAGIERRHAVELRGSRSGVHRRPGIVSIGNAAQTLHPVAGQGLNLGVRDAAVLAEICAARHRAGQALGDGFVSAQFARMRRFDRAVTSTVTDFLSVGFKSTAWPCQAGRGAGLLALEAMPALRERFGRRAMGLALPLPRLMRGLAL